MIETSRLHLRPATRKDAAFFLKLLNEDNYIKNIRDSKVRTLQDAENFIQNSYIKNYETYGFWLYVVVTKHDSNPVGVCGFVKRTDLDSPDLGFALLERETGKGYIKESAEAILRYGTEKLGLEKVYAITSLHNHRSKNVLKNLGFHFKKQVVLSHSPETLDLFERP